MIISEIGCSTFNYANYLKSGVHLHEIVLVAVSVKNELDSARVVVVNCLCCRYGAAADFVPKVPVDVAGRLLYHLLMPSLDTTVPLEQMHVVFEHVAENLALNVSRTL